jgi:Cft2 family RNA processing exonuclease
MRPYLGKNPSHKRAGEVAQGEFKPQYCTKKTTTESWSLSHIHKISKNEKNNILGLGLGLSGTMCAQHAQGSGFNLQHAKKKKKSTVFVVLSLKNHYCWWDWYGHFAKQGDTVKVRGHSPQDPSVPFFTPGFSQTHCS